MSGRRYRAWRFVIPGPGASDQFAGLQYSVRGGIDMVHDDESVRQAILLLISTIPGERVMRPGYGCHLNRLMFSPNDGTTAGLAMHYVRRAIDLWESRVDIVNLNAEAAAERPEVLEIDLEYRVRATRRTDRLSISVNLQGGPQP